MTKLLFYACIIPFSKRFEYLSTSVAFHFRHYNFCRIHKTLRVTPATEAGVTDRLYDMDWLLALVDQEYA